MHIWQGDTCAAGLKVTLWEPLAEKVQHVKGKRGSKGQLEKIIVANMKHSYAQNLNSKQWIKLEWHQENSKPPKPGVYIDLKQNRSILYLEKYKILLKNILQYKKILHLIKWYTFWSA